VAADAHGDIGDGDASKLGLAAKLVSTTGLGWVRDFRPLEGVGAGVD
jgi:hypothetical protein